MEAAQRKAKKGDVVEILNRTLGGEPTIEGRAQLLKLVRSGMHGDPDTWLVHFQDDSPGDNYERYVYD